MFESSVCVEWADDYSNMQCDNGSDTAPTPRLFPSEPWQKAKCRVMASSRWLQGMAWCEPSSS